MNVYVEKVKSSAELSNNLLEKGTPEEILSFQNEIEENVQKVKNERPTLMKPVHDGNIQYKANPVNNIHTISNLDNMGEVGKIFLISIFNVGVAVFVKFYIKLPMVGILCFFFICNM